MKTKVAEDTLPDGTVVRTIRLPGLTPFGGYEYETMIFPSESIIDEETVQEVYGGVYDDDDAARAAHRELVADWSAGR